jgi:hypothetical protein
MQEQVHHIFVDGIAYCLYEKKKKTTYDFTIRVYKKSKSVFDNLATNTQQISFAMFCLVCW